MIAFIYFIQAGDEHGHIKIGHSRDVDKRLESLRTGNHLPLRVLFKIPHPNAHDIEQKLHAEFADLRAEGEWFRFDAQILLVAKALDAVVHDGSDGKWPDADTDGSRSVTADIRNCYVAEWSHTQGCFHITDLANSLSMAAAVLLGGKGYPTDYVILGMFETEKEASAFARAIEPRLRAVRFARRIAEGK